MPFKSFQELDNNSEQYVQISDEKLKELNREKNIDIETNNLNNGENTPYRITDSEYEETINNSNGRNRYTVIDYRYFSIFSSPHNLFETEIHSSEDIMEEVIDDVIDAQSENDKIDPHYVANKILSAVPKVGGVRVFNNIDEDTIDLNNLKKAVINALTGYGNPENAHHSLLDKQALKNNIYKYNHEKIEKLTKDINKNMDKIIAPVLDPKSTYNRVRLLGANGSDLADTINDKIQKFNMGEYDIKEGPKTGELNPESLKDFFKLYNNLKDRYDAWFFRMSLKNPGVHGYDKDTLKAAEKFMKETLGMTEKSFEDRIDINKEVNDYKECLNSELPYITRNIQSLTKCVEEYNKHGFLWKAFLGRSARNERDNFANKLIESGVPKEYVNAIKDGSINNREFLENEYKNITGALEDKSYLTLDEIRNASVKLNTLIASTNDKEMKFIFNEAKTQLTESIADALRENGINDIYSSYIDNTMIRLEDELDFDSIETLKDRAEFEVGNKNLGVQNEEFIEDLGNLSNPDGISYNNSINDPDIEIEKENDLTNNY